MINENSVIPKVETVASPELKRKTEKVVHEDGSVWDIKAIGEDGEYYPSFKNAIFERADENAPEIIPDNIVMAQLGTFSDPVSSEEIQEFISQYQDRIVDPELLDSVRAVIEDRTSLNLLKAFFDEGGILAKGYGHFFDEPLKIQFGEATGEISSAEVLYHELLHYLFFKKKLVLANPKYVGGADHFIIAPLEQRFRIISDIRNQSLPLKIKIDNVHGYTVDGAIAKKIGELLFERGDLNELEVYINSEKFFRNFVYSGLTIPLSSRERDKSHRDLFLQLSNNKSLILEEDYTRLRPDEIIEEDQGEYGVYVRVLTSDIRNLEIKNILARVETQDTVAVENFINAHQLDLQLGRGFILSDDQLCDLAYLNALNASIFQQAFQLAIFLSKKLNIPVNEILKQPEYQIAFGRFVTSFSAREQTADNHFPVKKTAHSIMEEIISEIK